MSSAEFIYYFCLMDSQVAIYFFSVWVGVELCVTLKTGTGGGEKKRARVGEGYEGLRDFEKGEKRENKRRRERFTATS